ncbi:MAG: hypothetical protein JWL60_812 [Gemmatimonadetes bacterium]|nr:hypothetical protein [Gemmatimonadota bacterium]
MTPYGGRLATARAVLAALAVREREHGDAGPIRFVHEQDMRTGRYVIRAQPAQPTPGAIVDDVERVLREVRAVLDEAATALAGAPVKFPLFESLPVFAQRARKAIARLPDEAQAALEALQPYHAIGGYRNGPLWILDQLAAEHPPRLAAGALRAGAELGVNTRRKVELIGDPVITEGAFAAGDVVASQDYRIVGPDPKIDMYFRAAVGLAFAANGPGRGRGVVELVGELAGHVEHVVLPALGLGPER